jgi:hypothetical protein
VANPAPPAQRCQLALATQLIGHWQNAALSVRRHKEFILPLDLGPDDDSCYLHGALVSEVPITDRTFVFDTGANLTLIQHEVAAMLQLQPTGAPEEIGTAGPSPVRCTPSRMRIRTLAGWIPIPVWIRPEGDLGSSLLGMTGLLDRHVFCLSQEHLYVFAKP